jgi:hypothetical protein
MVLVLYVHVQQRAGQDSEQKGRPIGGGGSSGRSEPTRHYLLMMPCRYNQSTSFLTVSLLIHTVRLSSRFFSADACVFPSNFDSQTANI